MTANMILVLFVVFHVVTPSYGTDEESCQKLKNITKPSGIVTKINQFKMDASTMNISNGTVVSLVCNDNVTLTLSGQGVIQCINGTWKPRQPYCVPKPVPPKPPEPQNPHLDIIIVGGLCGCFVLLILVSVPEVVKKGKAWRLRNKKETLLGENNSKRFYKVWTCGRNAKQFVKAKGLSALKREASRILKKSSVVRIVLEEDGTEIDTDNILDACADQTLMALGEGELWWDRNVNSDDGRFDEKRLTFDICNQDRTKRKLVLGADLRDLCRQGQLIFGYLPLSACLESDGTMIGHDVLFAFAGSTIMLLDRGGAWSPVTTSVYTLPDVDRRRSHNSVTNDMMFKVWSHDHSVKLVVFAKNLADIHIKAAKYHGVPNPVEISELSTGKVVTSDTQLTALANDVLIIKSLKKTVDNNYVYIDDMTEGVSRVRSLQTDFPTGKDRSDDYAEVQKIRPNRERPVSGVNSSQQSVSSSINPYGVRRSIEIPFTSGLTTPEDSQVPNRMTENPAYAMWPAKQANERGQNSPFIEQDPRSTSINNFGYLRDMSDESKRKHNFYEMTNLKTVPIHDNISEYSRSSRSHFEYSQKPMVVTGGAKQSKFSDVLF